MITEDADDLPGPDEVRDAVERLIQSAELRGSPQLAAFLRFIVNETLRGESKRIKAYTIAVEALGRGENFDPESDSIVRVEAGRLRRVLQHHYAKDGANEAIGIDLPRGSYVPTFRRRREPVSPVTAAEEEAPGGADDGGFAGAAPSRRGVSPGRALALAAAAVIVVAAIGLMQFRGSDQGAAAPPLSGGTSGDPTGAVRPGPVVSVQRFEAVGEPTSPAFSIDRLRDELTDAMARFDGINVVAELDSPDGASDWSEYRLSGRAEYGADGTVSFSFRLVDAADGTVVWSPVFHDQEDAPDPDAAVDAIVREMASTIAEPFGILWTRELSDHGDRDLRRTCLVETVEYWRRFDIVRHERVRKCLTQMIADYPSYATGYSGLALVYLRDFYLDLVHPGELPALDRALQFAQRAVELKPQSGRAHDALSVVRFARGEIAPAFLAADRARELNPYDTNTLANYGSRLVAIGEVDKGLAMLNEAAAHALVRPAWFDSYLFIGAYLADDHAAASQHAAMIANDGSPIGLIARAVAADMAGDHAKARLAVDKLVAINPLWRTEPRRLLTKYFPSTEVQDRLVRVLEAEGLAVAGTGG